MRRADQSWFRDQLGMHRTAIREAVRDENQQTLGAIRQMLDRFLADVHDVLADRRAQNWVSASSQRTTRDLGLIGYIELGGKRLRFDGPVKAHFSTGRDVDEWLEDGEQAIRRELVGPQRLRICAEYPAGTLHWEDIPEEEVSEQ